VVTEDFTADVFGAGGASGFDCFLDIFGGVPLDPPLDDASAPLKLIKKKDFNFVH